MHKKLEDIVRDYCVSIDKTISFCQDDDYQLDSDVLRMICLIFYNLVGDDAATVLVFYYFRLYDKESNTLRDNSPFDSYFDISKCLSFILDAFNVASPQFFNELIELISYTHNQNTES